MKKMFVAVLLCSAFNAEAQMLKLEMNSLNTASTTVDNSDPLSHFKNMLYRDFFRTENNSEAKYVPVRSFSINIKLGDNKVDTVFLSKNSSPLTRQFVADNYKKANYRDLLVQATKNGWSNINVIIPVIELFQQAGETTTFESLVENSKILTQTFSYAENEYWAEKSVVLETTVIVHSKPVR